ncbi:MULTISPECIES: hypothetical protein [Cryobacterium]|uniref:hypothetical protein n=1 Tax=Cryobacterium TaxID=69578 RepID=UPI000CD3B194|nr:MULTISPECIES: hypothetical protein [Cryobacterium]POH64575.1 hypothetical protein C3B60_14190 [Cryobacterium zongtaii]TFC46286.1 hypothetical protein E3O57_07090 [Cryobacterium sp. TMN-39-2]
MNGHNHGGKSHLIGMIVIGVVILGGLLVAGRSIGEALPLAAVLACPVVMLGMMFMMMRSKNKDADTPRESPLHGDTGSNEAAKTTTQA